MDGKIVEGIEHKLYKNVIGCQFHPEFDTLWDRETSVQVDPEDEPTSLRAILDTNPPSFDFHRRIWAWYTESLLAQRDGQ
jgi:hypothetical protein